jgi:hypothetical protein
MFRAFSCPSSGATTTAVAASGLRSELGDSSAIGRGRATAVVASDDGHDNDRNMLSCIQTTSNKLEKLLHLVG